MYSKKYIISSLLLLSLFSIFTYTSAANIPPIHTLKLQTPKQFFETIDETIKQLGISVEDLTISILRDRGRELAESYQTLFKIMVDLIAKGYKRYPDLSR